MTQAQSKQEQEVQIPSKLIRLIKPKRFKIIIGGRGGAKSESVAALFAGMVDQAGCRAVCCREYQTSIKQSVHSLMSRKIRELELTGFGILATEIIHDNGGGVSYQGLARDPQAIKSIDNAELCWVEEAQSLSEASIEELTPSIRGNDSEIWMTANLQSSNDPFSKRFFKPFEKELRKNGYFEDDLHTIVWINYYDNPWFPPQLEKERARDKETMSDAGYAHKWLGEPSDTVEDAIIMPEWFDACIDAHIKLGFEPRGEEVVSHDPSDTGPDSKANCYRHGNVIKDVQERDFGDVNQGGDWAVNYTLSVKPDRFIWDGDGMGTALKRQFNEAFADKKLDVEMFKGSESPDRPDDYYETVEGETNRSRKKIRDTFRNKRAQYAWELRDRIYRTYLAVNQGKCIIDQDELISFSSEIKDLALLRSEMCRVPQKYNSRGLIQIMTKKEMRSLGIESPNMFDAVMMSLMSKPKQAKVMHINFESEFS